jgi:hypothetical protein
MVKTTAVEMAKKAEGNPKTFPRALRKEKFPWHQHRERWTVEIGSEHHAEMNKVLQMISR